MISFHQLVCSPLLAMSGSGAPWCKWFNGHTVTVRCDVHCILFLIIAPQNKKRKEHQKMIDSMEKGTKVKTVGGILEQ